MPLSLHPNAPLHLAAGSGHTVFVQWLWSQGVTLDARLPTGDTSLMLAAIYGHGAVAGTSAQAFFAVCRNGGDNVSPDTALQAGLPPH